MSTRHAFRWVIFTLVLAIAPACGQQGDHGHEKAPAVHAGAPGSPHETSKPPAHEPANGGAPAKAHDAPRPGGGEKAHAPAGKPDDHAPAHGAAKDHAADAHDAHDAHAPAAPADAHAGTHAGAGDPDAIWEDLAAGNRRFVDGKPKPREFVELRKQLATGQHPRAAILTCADSRVAPEIIFDQNLGDVFVVRMAGATADPVALGSLEYAVEHLHVPLIVIVGHEKCGAVAAAAGGEKMPTANLEAVVSNLKPALADLPKDQVQARGVGACVDLVAQDLRKDSPILREKLDNGSLTIMRTVYSLETGAVERRDENVETSPEAVWKELVEGNARFVAGEPRAYNLAARRRRVAAGQHPRAIVLTCADSRVAPELVFDQSLGDVFVVRNAGNLADPLSLGSIEYAVEHLHARLIIVMGHEKCGAVAAAVAGQAMPTPNLQAIVDDIGRTIAPLKAKGLSAELASRGPIDNVMRVAKDLVDRSSIVREAVENGHAGIVRCLYQLESGTVVRFDAPAKEVGAAEAPAHQATAEGHR